MITKIAEKNFNYLWKQFDNYLENYGGALFRIDPLKRFFPIELAQNLTEVDAKKAIYLEVGKWGKMVINNDSQWNLRGR